MNFNIVILNFLSKGATKEEFPKLQEYGQECLVAGQKAS